MADETIRMAVEAVNKAKAVLDDVADQLGGVGKEAEKTEKKAKGVQKALQQIGTAATGFIAGMAIGALRGMGDEMIDLAVDINRARRQLDAISEGNAPEYIAAIRESTQGLVTELGAAQIATNLLGLGLANTEEQAAEFARIAAILGGTFRGLNADQAAEEFGLLMSNMSILRLDTFGISASKVRARIRELQAQTAGMTREQAFYIAAMEEATAKADELSGALEDQASKVERARSWWADFRTEVASTAVTLAFDAAEGVQGFEDRTNDLRDAALRNSDSFQEYNQYLREHATFLERLEIFADIGTQAQFNLNKATLEAIDAAERGTGAWAAYADVMQGEVVPALQEAAEFSPADIFSMEEGAASNMLGFLEMLGQAQEEALDPSGVADLALDVYERMGASQEELLSLALSLRQETGEWTNELFNQGAAIQDIVAAMGDRQMSEEQGLQLLSDLQEGNITAAEATAEVESAAYRTQAGLDAMGMQGLTARDQILTVGKEGTPKMEGLSSSVAGVAKNFLSAAVNAERLKRALQSMPGGISASPPSVPGFQHGGQFVVGGAPGVDRNLVAFRATRGETVTVTPAGRGAPAAPVADAQAVLGAMMGEFVRELRNNGLQLSEVP